MSKASPSEMRSIVGEFSTAGRFVDGVPYGNGHINDTYAVTLQQNGAKKRTILQRVNHTIFQDVPGLMDNIVRVTEHLHRKLAAMPGRDPDRETLTVVPTRAGGRYYQRSDGTFWRMYDFIEQARTYEMVTEPEQAFQAAYAFGLFQKWLQDLPAPRLRDTIPDFHHTPKRFEALERAIRRDPVGRAEMAGPEIAFALERQAMTGILIHGLEAGELPERVTHNDTKLNNVMLDDATGNALCVIDLDTVMPGLVLYDFGDMVRTSTCMAAEDERDLRKVRFEMPFFEALVSGYLEATGDALAGPELDLLAFSGKLITFEIGIRFLTDYLEGDVYFKTHRPDHNLDRTRTQFALVAAMEGLDSEMKAVVERHRPPSTH